jgi:hypothetical protein
MQTENAVISSVRGSKFDTQGSPTVFPRSVTTKDAKASCEPECVASLVRFSWRCGMDGESCSWWMCRASQPARAGRGLGILHTFPQATHRKYRTIDVLSTQPTRHVSPQRSHLGTGGRSSQRRSCCASFGLAMVLSGGRQVYVTHENTPIRDAPTCRLLTRSYGIVGLGARLIVSAAPHPAAKRVNIRVLAANQPRTPPLISRCRPWLVAPLRWRAPRA